MGKCTFNLFFEAFVKPIEGLYELTRTSQSMKVKMSNHFMKGIPTKKIPPLVVEPLRKKNFLSSKYRMTTKLEGNGWWLGP